MIKNAFIDVYMARKVLREISILRQLTVMANNIFTCKLIDLIIPYVP